jgi:hypothetical protein
MAKAKLGELIINTFSPALQIVVTTKFNEILDDLAAKNPEAHKTICTSLYGPIDVHLEGLVAGTKTKIDDAIVSGLKEAIELSAETAGVELQNLDQD